MKPSTQDRAEGKLHEVKGKVKEEVGKATNDPKLEDAGAAEKNAGKVQNWIGRAEKAVGELKTFQLWPQKTHRRRSCHKP